MQATLITLAGMQFLLPADKSDYEFPSYVLKHKPQIERLLVMADHALSNPLADPLPGPTREEMREFRERTGIVGYPIDLHDPVLYAVDRQIEIILEVNLDGGR